MIVLVDDLRDDPEDAVLCQRVIEAIIADHVAAQCGSLPMVSRSSGA